MSKQHIERRPQDPAQLKAIVQRRWRLALVSFTLPCAFVLGLAESLPPLFESRALVLAGAPTGASADGVSAARLEQLTKENVSVPRLAALLGKRNEPSDSTAVQALQRDVVVETEKVNGPSGQMSIGVAIRVRSFDNERAAQLANALADFYVDAERTRLAEESSAVDVRMKEARARLDEEERRLKDFESRHLGELPEQVQLHLASLERLNAQLELVRENRTRTLERSRMPRETAVAPPVIDPNDVELARMRQSLADLRARYTDAHPDVARMRRAIENLEALRKPAPAPSAPTAQPARDHAVDAELAALAQEERAIEGRIAAVQHQALSAAPRGQERASLLPTYEAARTSYTDLLRRYEELQARRIEGAKVAFRVVEAALPAHDAALPNRPRLIGLGIIFAGLAALAMVWLREQVDRTFHTSGELRAFSGVPVLGHIPRVSTAGDRWRRRARTVLGAAILALAVYVVLLGAQSLAADPQVFHIVAGRGTP